MAHKDPAEGRIAKRQKVTNGALQKKNAAPAGSRVFLPYRTIGLVSPTAVPFTTVPLGKTTYQITTSIGRSLQTYDLRRGLNLVFVTRPQTPETITASAAWKDKVLAAWGGETESSARGVWVYKRGKREAELEWPSGDVEDCRQNVTALCVLGAWIIGVCSTQLLVWKSSTLEFYTCLRGISPVPFTHCISALPTFLNKILIGRTDGSAEIWNVSSGRLLYTLLPPSTAYGAVTAIEPTPALALVAIAYANGALLIRDIKSDDTLIAFATNPAAPVTSISFRTDGLGAGDDGQASGVMATASSATGDITMWDLNAGGRKTGVLRPAHAHPTPSSPGGTSKISFLPGQAILVSSGLDNTLKTWIFDQTPFNPLPRILHARGGHAAPVSRLAFLPTAADGSDDTGKWLLSASRDRGLWGWSLRRDGQSTELSQGAVLKKAKKQGLMAADVARDSLEQLKCPPITSLACCLNRDGGIGALPGKQPMWQAQAGGRTDKKKKATPADAEISAMTGWESVLTAHEGDRRARTWFWGRKRAGRWAFETGDGGDVSSVALSPCGTFAVVGSATGAIDMFNMQSGLHRQRFPARLTPAQAQQLRAEVEKFGLIEESGEGSGAGKKFYRGQGRHAAAVVGLAVDALNKTVMSAGRDGKVKFWSMAGGLLQDEIRLPSETVGMRYHRSSELLALAGTDGCLRIVDSTSRRLIRELWLPSHASLKDQLQISDFCFSQDGRWIAAAAGPLVFLWDLPTGHLIDAFRLRDACTSLAFSPTGEFLATATRDSVGVDLWTNRALFTARPPARHLREADLARVLEGPGVAPTVSGEGGKDILLAGADDAAAEDGDDYIDLDAEDSASATQLDVLSNDLLSLSLVPRARWQNLIHLDLLKQRNKPIEGPQKPEKAPFFLPSLQPQPGQPSQPVTLAETNAAKNNLLQDSAATAAAEALKKEQSRIMKLSDTAQLSRFSTLLEATTTTGDRQPALTDFLEYFSNLSPAAADIEIRSLQSAEFRPFLDAVISLLREKRAFELCQAWMKVFLRVHGDVLLAEDDDEDQGDVQEALREWQSLVQGEMERVSKRAGYVTGLVGFLRAGRV